MKRITISVRVDVAKVLLALASLIAIVSSIWVK